MLFLVYIMLSNDYTCLIFPQTFCDKAQSSNTNECRSQEASVHSCHDIHISELGKTAMLLFAVVGIENIKFD
jgi:hypothetical protein